MRGTIRKQEGVGKLEKSHQWVYNSGMPFSGRIEYLTLNESNALLKAIDDTRDHAIICLFLNAGLFLREMIEIQVDSIDWEKRVLRVPGEREREIGLDEQAYEALARWSQERPAVRHNAFFITSRGKATGLTTRAVDKLIRKYTRRAGIRRNVNAQALRNSFAVKLFSQEIGLDQAAALLGISDPASFRAFIRAAKVPRPQVPERVDTRSKLARAVNRIFPTKPKAVKATTESAEAGIPSLEGVIFGRESTVSEIKANIAKNNPMLLVGPLGSGKTHLLRYIKNLFPAAILIESPAPTRLMLEQILDGIDPGWKKRVEGRGSIRELAGLVKAKEPLDSVPRQARDSARGKGILMIDNLQRLKGVDAEIVINLMASFTVIAAAEEMTERLRQLWFKFKQIKLGNLSHESSQKLIRYLTQKLAISDQALLETRVLTLSNGLPMAIVDMIGQIGHLPTGRPASPDDIREIYHEAGIRYRDWTPFLIILWGVAMVFRFIALGTHSFEGYILAGIGIAALMTTIRFLRMFK